MNMTNTRRPALFLATLALGLGAGGVQATAAPATSADAATTPSASALAAAKKAKDKCVKGSTSSAGTCFQVKKKVYKVVGVEAVPLRNKSSKPATMHCSFTKTISRSMTKTAGLSTTGEVNAVFGLAKVSVTAQISKSVTQTASQATTAGGSIRLKPKQKVTCVRTYGYVAFKVRRYSYSGTKITSDKIITTKIPSSLGVDIVD